MCTRARFLFVVLSKEQEESEEEGPYITPRGQDTPPLPLPCFFSFLPKGAVIEVRVGSEVGRRSCRRRRVWDGRTRARCVCECVSRASVLMLCGGCCVLEVEWSGLRTAGPVRSSHLYPPKTRPDAGCAACSFAGVMEGGRGNGRESSRAGRGGTRRGCGVASSGAVACGCWDTTRGRVLVLWVLLVQALVMLAYSMRRRRRGRERAQPLGTPPEDGCWCYWCSSRHGRWSWHGCGWCYSEGVGVENRGTGGGGRHDTRGAGRLELGADLLSNELAGWCGCGCGWGAAGGHVDGASEGADAVVFGLLSWGAESEEGTKDGWLYSRVLGAERRGWWCERGSSSHLTRTCCACTTWWSAWWGCGPALQRIVELASSFDGWAKNVTMRAGTTVTECEHQAN
ncbi:hypothetical protein B0H14DRAFT_3171356 [Mycena olivaceomarginata]|nr:hypothetical protein B0H14DRAFT_3171356 [Mycena olivaceomarginata]